MRLDIPDHGNEGIHTNSVAGKSKIAYQYQIIFPS
jgi:hypothetical protein